MAADTDKVGSGCTPAQLYSAWRSCVHIQPGAPVTTGGRACLSHTSTKHLQTGRPNTVNQNVAASPATWSVYQNFRSILTHSLVVRCENTEEHKKNVDRSRMPYRVRDDELHDAIQEYINKETPRDRFNLVLKKHEGEFRGISPELQLFGRSMVMGTGLAVVAGLVRGGLRLRAPVVEGTTPAVALSMGHMMTRLAGDCLRLTARLVPLIAIGLGATQAIAIYRNKSTPFEYSAGTTLAFGVGSMHLGLQPMAAHVMLGFLLGTLSAPIFYGILILNKSSQEQLHYHVIEARIRHAQALKKRKGVDMV